MRWDPDRELAKFEPERCRGTSFTRVYLSADLFEQYKVKLTPQQVERGGGDVWCLSLGLSYAPKAFFYGQTMREAFLKARKAAKKEELAAHTPWGVQDFKPTVRKSRPKAKKWK